MIYRSVRRGRLRASSNGGEISRSRSASRLKSAIGRRERVQHGGGVGCVGEVAGQHLDHGLVAPGGDQVGVAESVAVGGAVFDSRADAQKVYKAMVVPFGDLK